MKAALTSTRSQGPPGPRFYKRGYEMKAASVFGAQQDGFFVRPVNFNAVSFNIGIIL